MKTIPFILLLFISIISLGQKPDSAASLKPKQVCEADLQWIDTKPPMLPGAKMAIVEGNPKAAGHFTLRLKFPPYYKIPAHIHPVDERTTVIKGIMNIGFGDVLDTTNAKKLTVGCFYMNPAGIHHYAFTSEAETEIEISTNGPWGLELLKK